MAASGEIPMAAVTSRHLPAQPGTEEASAVYQAIIADHEIAYKPGPSISPQLAPADALPSSPSVRARQANRATE